MSVNRHLPHLFILPEDDANRQLANGFALGVATNQLRVLPEAGGWAHVRDTFASDHVDGMQRFDGRLMVLLVDFDNNPSRLQDVQAGIPDDLADRVFILGVMSEPEDLKRNGLGSYESIGKALADECRTRGAAIWSHRLLQHNAAELERLRGSVCDLLFPPEHGACPAR